MVITYKTRTRISKILVFILLFGIIFSTNMSVFAAIENEEYITAAKTGITADDTLTAAIDMGFDFTYFGSTYSKVKISTNGYMCMGTGSSNYAGNHDLSSESDSCLDNIMAPFWDDLVTKGGGYKLDGDDSIWYATTGEAPNRMFIVQWGNMYFFSNTDLSMGTFQAILYESTNEIQFQYREITGAGDEPKGSSATIGIRGTGISNTVQYSYNGTNLVKSEQAINFTPSGSTYTVNDSATYDPVYLLTGAAPGVPQIISPLDGANTGLSASLVWSSAANATSYRVIVATDENFSTIIKDNTGTKTSYTASGLKDGTTYYWKVYAINSEAQNASPVYSFTVSAAPSVNSVNVPANGTYKAGDNLEFTVNFNKGVTVDTSRGMPYLPLIIGENSLNAVYSSGSGTSALVFKYTVKSGDSDTDGIAIGESIILNEGTIKDSDSTDATLTLNSIGDTSEVFVDTTAPTDGSISINNGDTYTSSTTVTLSLSAAGASRMMISEDSSFTGASYEAYAASKSFTLSSTDETKTVYVKYRDEAGNETSSTISDSIVLDTTAPTVIITSTAVDPTNGVIPVEIRFSESVEGFDVSDISVGNGNASNLTVTGAVYAVDITPISDGLVTVDIPANIANDRAGNPNKAASQFSITYDKTLPVITVIGESVVQVELGDEYIDEGATASDNLTNSIIIENTVNTNEVGDYTVTYNVTDDAGNNGNTVVRAVYVRDTTVPRIEISGNPVDWQKSDADIDVTVTDLSDIEAVKWEYGEQNKEYFADGGNIITSAKKFTAIKSSKFTVYAKDEHGNENTYEFEVTYIDKTSPTDPQIIRTPERDYYNEDYTIELISGSDSESGAGESVYRLTNGLNTTEWLTYTGEITITDEGTTRIEAKTIDKVGNESGIVTGEVFIDRDLSVFPVININPDKDYSNESYEVTLSLADIDNQTVDQSVYSNVYYNLEGAVDLDWSLYKGKFDIEKVGETKIRAKIEDVFGNTSIERDKTVYIDITDPAVPVISVQPDSGISNNEIVVAIEAGTDTQSGIDRVIYTLDSGLNWIDYDEPFSIYKTGDTTITAKTLDKAGNESDEAQITVTIEKDGPTAALQYSTTEWTNGNVEVTLIPDEEITITNNEGQLSYKFTQNGEFTFEFIDKAGNTGSKKAVVSNIDKAAPTAPAIRRNPDVDSTTRSYTITITNGEDELSGANETLYRLSDAKTSNWAKYENSFSIAKIGTTTIEAKTIDNAANESEISTINITVREKEDDDDTTSHEKTSTKTDTVEENTGAAIIVNGQEEDNSAEAKIETVDDKKVTTVIIDGEKLKKRLDQENTKAVVTIPVNNNSDVVVGELNGQMVKNMEVKEAVLAIETEAAAYTLPAGEIQIDDISKKFGKQVELKDIKVSVEIAKTNDEKTQIIESREKAGEFSIVVSPVDFMVKCTNKDKTIEVKKFKSYVERSIAIPDGADPQKITTGVVLEDDGTLRHVPTKIAVVDGKYYAKINSLTNSTYSVIYHPKEFVDVQNHWSKGYVNEMGSRLVVNGIDDNNFAPDRDITRGEFAAIIVRALGLGKSDVSSGFTDIKASDWEYGVVCTAFQYGIIKGYEDGTFRPDEKITREEAMVMISRVMKITGIQVELSDSDITSELDKFEDSIQSSNWAKAGIASAIKYEIIKGNSGKIKPNDEITRGETAAIVMRMLEKADLT